MKNTVMQSLLRNMALCLATGGILAACGGGDSQGPTASDTKLMADGEPCNAAWVSSTAYGGGGKVSRSGRNYTANWWTQGNDPVTSSGPAGSGQPWLPGYLCGGTTTTTKASTTTTKASTTTTKASTTTTKASTTTTKASTTTTGTGTTTTTKATTTTTVASSCPAYVAGTAYAAGKTVTNAGGYYTCTVAGWCSSGASAYEPGVGWAWTSAWSTSNASACGGVTSTTTTTKASTTTTKASTTTTGTGTTTTSGTTTTTASGGVPTKAQAEANEAALTNNAFFRSVKASIRTLPNANVEAVTPGNSANPINVKRVERLLPAAKWDFYFAIRDSSYSYQRFLQAVAKFPAICDDYTDGRNADAICRHSLASMFAHFAQETGDHNASLPTPQWRQGLKYLREMGCEETGPGCGYNAECTDPTFSKIWTCGKNADGSFKKYFGRGAKQLSYNYNYGPFSQAMNNGDQSILLKNPDLVASTWLNLTSATFFFVFPQPPKPSMLHVLDGTWVPNATDTGAGAGNNFGTTIMIINGGLECGSGAEKPAAQNRIDYYKQFAADLGWNYSTESLSCGSMKAFTASSSAAYNIYWEKNWSNGGDYKCQLVSYQTPYNALLEGNYVKCVQDNWGVTLQ